MGHTDDLLLGLALLHSASGVGTYSDTTGYTSGQTGIGLGKLPSGCDLAIAFTDYSVSDTNPDLAMTTIFIQALYRGTPDDRKSMTDLRDASYDLLQNLPGRQVGAGHIDQCFRVSTVPLGMDDENRWLQADNYQIDLSLAPTATRQ